ncbi:SIR2 family protein [Pseudomonas ogarae]|uniref:SIR2 family NAD-dependent protein deacylase n=1 Tax=Pseudomonas ogarae (strain DSM 112162 / CECT 30235 / F113) TaxID=1114970 RepID=UPI00164802C5|nr:SIR2 family protein [Pseudomonas zarinae]QXH94291.1 SIR2 family protein [Pseudomonas zarinae]
MIVPKESWCQQDGHTVFDLFREFNDWINQGELDLDLPLLEKLTTIGLSSPSKAFYAGDKAAYEQALRAYRLARRQEALGLEYLIEAFGPDDGQHWYDRNEQRFNQLIDRIVDEMVVPFIGAGISVGGGFPTWADHLRQQGRTAGIAGQQIETWLAQGEFEQVIAHIEQVHGRDVFSQEIRDVFGKRGSIQNITLTISEIFKDTLITTNYDQLLEQVFETGALPETQIINGVTAMTAPDPNKTTIIKMHGDIKHPAQCILGKAQYDQAYGEVELDLDRAIPKMLRYYFTNNSLLFIGCSLNNDRTIQVFREIKARAGDYSFPQHFSIEQTPDCTKNLVARNVELARLGITAIWYPQKKHEYVETILRCIRNELNYKKAAL